MFSTRTNFSLIDYWQVIRFQFQFVCTDDEDFSREEGSSCAGCFVLFVFPPDANLRRHQSGASCFSRRANVAGRRTWDCSIPDEWVTRATERSPPARRRRTRASASDSSSAWHERSMMNDHWSDHTWANQLIGLDQVGSDHLSAFD